MNDRVDWQTAIEPIMAYTWIQDGMAYLIDIRCVEELSIDGYISGAHIIPFQFFDGNGMQENPHFISTIKQLYQKLGENKKICLLCRNGTRSALASSILYSTSHIVTYSIDGGIISWNESGLPNKLYHSDLSFTNTE